MPHARLEFFWRPALIALLTLALPAMADAQYFGRNKVQYDDFAFRILPTDHFRIHFYPAESLATADASRMAERWYERHHETLRFSFTNNPIIFYADPPDFQQSNVVEGEISQGTGGVTEGARERVIMPFTGSYAESDHVLGHELVHVFQYRIAEASRGGLRAVETIPLWLIEGMAEYLSLGRDDPNTAMWLRDALRRNDVPSITQLTKDPRYFPYRYGQALWAFIGGTWGDSAVDRVFRAAVASGWEKGVKNALGVSVDSLSTLWHSSIKTAYGPVLADRTAPDSTGRAVVVSRSRGEHNVSPAVSPDGRRVAYFSSRGLFGIDLYVADATTGKVIRQLTSATTDPHFDALSFISSAGSWSPDGRKIAFAVFAQGNQEIDIMDVESGHIEQAIHVPTVTSMSDPAWSPDGRQVAFTGMHGGISDLYLYDLQTKVARQLTNDREAQLQPAWSPDGTTLAFATDAGAETDLNALRYGPMRLALMDVASGRIRLLDRLPHGKAINPQFTPDGQSLYFVSDVDGVSDIYRVSLASGAISRLTRVATGVSGITSLSPAISVARSTGDVYFSVFDQQGFSVRALTGSDLDRGVAVSTGDSYAGTLPPLQPTGVALVSAYLADPAVGLPAVTPTHTVPYSPSLKLDYVGGPEVGVAVGGGYGAGVVGGVSLSFSDELGNHVLQSAVQAQGDVKDIGAQVMYLNRTHRWNWGLSAAHIPLVGGFSSYDNATFVVDGQAVDGLIYTQQLLRQYFQSAQAIAQYPLSATRRLELSAGGQRIAFDAEVDSQYVVGNTVLRETTKSFPGASPLAFATASLAYVGDYSAFGFTSPIAGGRYRFEITPSVGSINFATALADYRHYIFARPVTLAFRGLHIGRYGPGAESDRLQPFYVGQPYLIRGYDASSFDPSECTVEANSNDCPEFSRLNGSRLVVANAELRIPLLGTRQLGLLPFPVPLEVSPFVDGGLAWSAGDNVTLRFERRTTARVPVVSTGVSARVNLLGFAVLEVYWAKPFQRPDKNGVFGFQLQPGW